VAQAVKCLLCKHLLFEVKALSSNPIPAKQQKTVNKIQLQRKPSFKVLSLTRQHFAGFKIIPIQFYAMHFYKQSPKLYKAQAQEQQTQRDDETLLAGVCVCGGGVNKYLLLWRCQEERDPKTGCAQGKVRPNLSIYCGYPPQSSVRFLSLGDKLHSPLHPQGR
jgi:hypothetical protein